MTDISPMDRRELQACAHCKKGVMHDGNLHFYELTVSNCIADMRSIQQQHGLEVMFGGAAQVAAALAPSTVVANRMPPVRCLICADCAMQHQVPAAFYLELDEEESDA